MVCEMSNHDESQGIFAMECMELELGVLTALQVEDPLNWAAQLSIGYIITQNPGPC